MALSAERVEEIRDLVQQGYTNFNLVNRTALHFALHEMLNHYDDRSSSPVMADTDSNTDVSVPQYVPGHTAHRSMATIVIKLEKDGRSHAIMKDQTHDGPEMVMIEQADGSFWRNFNILSNGEVEFGRFHFPRRIVIIPEDKYLVIKRRDIDRYLNDVQERSFWQYVETIQERKLQDIPDHVQPNYIVINTDEPYADEIVDILQSNGHWGGPRK